MLTAHARRILASPAACRILVSPVTSMLLGIVPNMTCGSASSTEIDGVPAAPSRAPRTAAFWHTGKMLLPTMTSWSVRSVLYHMAKAQFSTEANSDHPTECFRNIVFPLIVTETVEEQYQKLLESIATETMPPNAWLWVMIRICSSALHYGGSDIDLNLSSLRGKSAIGFACALGFILECEPESAAATVKLLNKYLAESEKPNPVKDELKKLIAEWPPGLIENQKIDCRKVFSVPILRPSHGEAGAMLAISARSRRLLLPGIMGILPHLGSTPNRLPHARGFCTSMQTRRRYFTASFQESVSLDTTGYTSLKDIFLKPSKLSLHNHESNYGKHCFSNFSIAIFQKLAIISYQNAVPGIKWLCFDPNQILVRRCGFILLDVIVPELLLISVVKHDDGTEEPESIYKDCDWSLGPDDVLTSHKLYQ